MPLIIDGGRIPPVWAERKRPRAEASMGSDLPSPACLRVALINNMPDAAMEDTEVQFFELLENAAGHVPVLIKLFSLPGVLRGERGKQRVANLYYGIEELFNGPFDGVIVTGTEPHHPDLRHEPYWGALGEVLDWTERHTASTILSCLAAHAGVLYSDGIGRHPMWYKMCGVFECDRIHDHPLTQPTPDPVRFPHSRWNEVREDELTACGYTVLTKSKEAGVDCFVKRKRQSLFIHFQGHPEYEARTLFKEYRRDLRRFLTGERKNYPYVPDGYFDEAATQLLVAFRERVEGDPREAFMADFPEAALTVNLRRTWAPSANSIYRSWLNYLLSRRADAPTIAAVSGAVREPVQHERFATTER